MALVTISEYASRYEGNEDFIALVKAKKVSFKHMMDSVRKERSIGMIKLGLGNIVEGLEGHDVTRSGKPVTYKVTDKAVIFMFDEDGVLFDYYLPQRYQLAKKVPGCSEELLQLAAQNQVLNIWNWNH